ncbi:hypothetical protein BO71DRAFT_485365 [Aspergillus ellipticus CBS 707.79]|uniref:Zn(2)-C6 fungal-type domain-containing protein n=1 Tax=Aspergillus ellipticus CBS 707.79 TaxID=1448320 RepID=A0A319D5K2_9EURO|nr:hypothetical protein BO71DRAFT_485365 [Aspergillus ellipticus CBS 707.79]
MPRKKAADRVGPVKTRSRSGCKECRASRVRCDLTKPICTRCIEKGLVCSTQLVLKWESEFVSRGLAFGRAGVWSKARPAAGPPARASPASLDDQQQPWCALPRIEPWAFVNSGVSSFQQPYEPNALVLRTGPWRDDWFDQASGWSLSLDMPACSPVPLLSPQPAPPLSLFPSLSSDSNHGLLFDYYLQQVCPRTTASSKLSSPFASVILPFCMSASPIMFQAIQALGACHWSRFDSTYSVIGLRLKSEALRGLRHRLATEGSAACSADPEVLAIMMMLCLYEIVDNCDQRWTIHLKGAKELIRLRRQHQQQLSHSSSRPQDPVSTFAELFFAFQDVMGRTACGEEVLFGTDYWQENERNIDLWMGCSPELVSILSSITEMSRTRRQTTTSPAARATFSKRAASLGRRLESLVQDIDDANNNEDNTLRSVAELKRLAAVLYLHCALYGASPATPLVVVYVRRILTLASALLDSGSLVSMTWPLFVAAVELDPLHDEVWRDSTDATAVYGRPLVLRALAAMAESSVSNVARTRAVIVKVWQARESDMLKGAAGDAVHSDQPVIHADPPTDTDPHDGPCGLIVQLPRDTCNKWLPGFLATMTSSTTPSTLSHSLAIPFASRLSEQLSQRRDPESGTDHTHPHTPSHGHGDKSIALGPPLRPAPAIRSLSDAARPVAATAAAPHPDARPPSKDDSLLSSTPETPRRPSMPGLSLDLPSRAGSLSVSNRAPLSPKLDSSHIYGSPGSVLPRRSRGLDFSRACTNLHHSTLAEASPDSSPIIGGRGVNIPQRRGSPGSTSGLQFSTSNPADRATISSSMSSVNLLESDTSSSDEDDEPMMGDRDDMMITTTPQAKRLGGGMSPFAVGNVSSPGNEWMGGYSQAAASLMSFQRARFRKGRSRHSSSSNSGNSSKQSPGPQSPPVMKSIEGQNGSYFGPRRGSLSLGTRDLRLSDVSDEGESRARGQSPSTSNSEGGPLGVIRRAVTRRGSLLPKTKTFARIRAALMEESAPIDSEAKREAEVIRQVKESEPDQPNSPLGALSSLDTSTPDPGPTDDVPVKTEMATPDEPKFIDQANRNSGGVEFWNSFDERYRTPPPPQRRHGASSISEDDLAMDFTPSTTVGSHTEFAKPSERPGSRSETSQTHTGLLSEFKRKRRRDDDFDPNLLKRRAVSPSMSVQSSPIMPNSPVVKDTSPSIWGAPRSNLGSLFPERAGESPRGSHVSHGNHANANGNGNHANRANHTGTLKRVGLQGMTETNDGLMNMSIE